MKKYIHVKESKDGDIIAEDLMVNGCTIPLVMKDSILNEYMRNKIIINNIDRICVLDKKNDEETKDSTIVENYNDSIAVIKHNFANIAKGQKMELDDILKVSNFIFNNSECIYKLIHSMNIIKRVDEYTYSHSVNVAMYSMLIGKWIGLEEREIKLIIKAGLLHDIGKIKIPLTILNKKESLTDEEYKRIKKHVSLGYSICNEYDWLDDEVGKAVLLHHERQDGSGYPLGLSGENISLYAKIVAIADVYDAITSERIYKKRQTPFETFQEILSFGYSKFDVNIMNRFLYNIATIYVGEKVKMNNGDIGEIVFIPPDNIMYPIVKVRDRYYDLKHKENNYSISELL
ncbi:putative nucleotidyltransferase with HDIG domain [Natranaerovirga pectinivora]|uniref:Putative nucleotidyltransferase with HDIG domain n=1 Tax=Natranaerovirga pectinivora TaxID=682400 RepID=A0A4R3MLA9_9FIRM|nr:HD-GYP domain-containing protein [Natranaerovirga pectinivora]TCT14658.1 putative nucleotidyltransferase with HDIG domain [Natranaerovirga pectinivora]